MAAVHDPGDDGRIALQGPRARRDRDGDAEAVAEACEAPDARPAAILEMGFGAEIADTGPDLEVKFAPVVAALVAIRNGVFRPSS